MLRKLVSAALGWEAPAEDRPTPSGDRADRSVPDLAFPPMEPVRPPVAENDNPLAALCAAVEADLRAAGYLR